MTKTRKPMTTKGITPCAKCGGTTFRHIIDPASFDEEEWRTVGVCVKCNHHVPPEGEAT